ncbi:MAG: TIGR01620 family protein [Pseudomonadota bacterium]
MTDRPARPKPLLQPVDPAAEPESPSPQDAPPPPDATPPPVVRGGAPLLGGWTRLALAALGALASAGIALSVYDLVAELMARSDWLGWAALALAALAAIALLGLALSELAGLARLRRIEDLRDAAAEARATGEAAEAKAIARRLEALYARRRDHAWDWRALADKADDAVEPGPRLDLYELSVMGPLDEAARAVVRAHARRVAAATALMPSALLDGLAALYLNLRMINRIARIYGGRGGALGSWRLARRVVEHAMAAGLIALGDDLLEPLVGGGVASKLSRRAGEGLVNGALTARIGAAAIEICRPLPFAVLPKPKLRDLAWDAIRPRA